MGQAPSFNATQHDEAPTMMRRTCKNFPVEALVRCAGNRLCKTGQPLSRAQLMAISRHSYSSLSSRVRIVETGPRDGLQNIKNNIPTATKVKLIQRLASAGLTDIEATSFVSPRWVPQLADSADVMREMLRFKDRQKQQDLRFPVLVAPNLRYLEKALNAGAQDTVVFASATEAFSNANQNCTIEEALSKAESITKEALKSGLRVRGAVSCIFADPFSGPTPPEAVLSVVKRLLAMGCYRVALGDTLGAGTPKDTQNLLEVLLREIPADRLAGHFHDTYGQGVANVFRAYDLGIREFDSSVAGLGGCPFAPGAKGNVATEDVVYGFEKSGISTGIDLDKLVKVGQWISNEIGIPYGSRAGEALASKTSPAAPDTKVLKSSRSWDEVKDTGEYRISRSGTTMKITLTRPKNGNALTDSMLEGLIAIFRKLPDDPSIYHVVLASEGKFFCTGMDLSGKTNTSGTSSEGSTYYSKVVDLYNAIDSVPQTTIAMVDGPCYGGGVGLTFVCDIRLASPRARWTMSEVNIGVSPAVISKYMVREWGISLAREAMLTGREVRPETLKSMGVIHAISDDNESLDRKLESCLARLEKCAPRSAATNKALARLAWCDPEGSTQEAAVRETFAKMMACGSEGEHGIKQFQNKIKDFSWADFWAGRNPFHNLHVRPGEESN
ncbi:hypothetical protein ACJZ2D_006335 [Fusarium nematophilum]